MKAPEKGEDGELAPLNYGGRYLAINLALMVWFLFGAGMLYPIVYDQRYRCRVCRRLRMPVETGSRGFMLQMGRPRTEYICPYGHGTLKQEEFQTSAWKIRNGRRIPAISGRSFTPPASATTKRSDPGATTLLSRNVQSRPFGKLPGTWDRNGDEHTSDRW